jgi:hypothetical protein
MRKLFIFLVTAMMIFASFGTASALLTTYLDRTAWETDLGVSPDFLVDLNGFTEDTSFQSAALDLGPFSIEQEGELSSFRNIVDVPPYVEGHGVDGTPSLNLFVENDLVSVRMTFDDPVYGFFGDFMGAGNVDLLEMVLISDSGSTSIFVPGLGHEGGGFGFMDTDFAFNEILFLNNRNDRFDLDNIAGATIDREFESIPEPATIFLLGSSLIGLAGFSRRFKK